MLTFGELLPTPKPLTKAETASTTAVLLAQALDSSSTELLERALSGAKASKTAPLLQPRTASLLVDALLLMISAQPHRSDLLVWTCAVLKSHAAHLASSPESLIALLALLRPRTVLASKVAVLASKLEMLAPVKMVAQTAAPVHDFDSDSDTGSEHSFESIEE